MNWIESLLDEVVSLLPTVGRNAKLHVFEELPDEQLMRRPDEPYSASRLLHRRVKLQLALAREYIQMKDYREAEQLLTSWLESTGDPRERFDYLRFLIACYQSQAKDVEAGEAMERALVLKPDYIRFNNDLAYSWIDRGTRLEAAEPMIRYALSRTPRTGAYLDTYGWLLYKKGTFAEAKKWLERANGAGVGEDPVLLDHLGDVCWQLGLKEEAVNHWRHAVSALDELNPQRLVASDIKRVQSRTPEKIDAAEADGEPPVAPVALIRASVPANGAKDDRLESDD